MDGYFYIISVEGRLNTKRNGHLLLPTEAGLERTQPNRINVPVVVLFFFVNVILKSPPSVLWYTHTHTQNLIDVGHSLVQGVHTNEDGWVQ